MGGVIPGEGYLNIDAIRGLGISKAQMRDHWNRAGFHYRVERTGTDFNLLQNDSHYSNEMSMNRALVYKLQSGSVF